MIDSPIMLPPSLIPSLEKWHAMVDKMDFGDLEGIVHPDAILRSPVAINPYPSGQAVILAIETVSKVMTNFAYHRQFVSTDGLSVTLEFSAKVGEKLLKGADFIRFNEEGKIVEFEIMIRPFNSLAAMKDEMGKRLGHLLPGFKGRD